VAHTTELRFSYASPAAADVIYSSVEQEAGTIPGARTRGQITLDGATVAVSIDADDLPALRAGVNTWCSLVAAAEATVDATG